MTIGKLIDEALRADAAANAPQAKLEDAVHRGLLKRRLHKAMVLGVGLLLGGAVVAPLIALSSTLGSGPKAVGHGGGASGLSLSHPAVFDRVMSDGSLDLYIANTDASEMRQLTSYPGDEYSPSWSPDGSRIVFVRNSDVEEANIYVIDNDGSDLRQLTQGAEVDAEPTWSPDGALIAFERTGDSGHAELFTMMPDGSNEHQLTHNESMNLHPAWAPDSQSIAFVRDTGNDSEIVAVSLVDDSERSITDGSGGFGTPAWAPDGRDLAVSKDLDGDGSLDIGIVNVASGNVTPLANNLGPIVMNLGWTSDGLAILGTAISSASPESPETSSAFAVDVEDGTVTDLPVPALSTADW